jgi:predicted alpha-1,6-mannanase (GH76 family)
LTERWFFSQRSFAKMKTMNMKSSSIQLIIVSLLWAGISSSCLKQKDDDPTPPPGGGGQVTYNWSTIADSASKSLSFFWSGSGKFFTTTNTSAEWTQYWPNAHGLDVLVDAYIRTSKDATIKAQMDAFLTGVKAKNGNTWLNYYYDDMEWMALACLRAYNATNDAAYKDVVDILWADIKNGWTSDLGGGIWWNKENGEKGACSNMPAAILAARLYQQFNRAEDLQWAQQIYTWQKNVLYESSTGLVYNDIKANGNKNITWKFTYNQGTFIGTALELYKITGSSSYLSDALKAADYTINSGFLTSNGILKDEGGGDGGLFKGVFVRYFTRLIVEGGLDDGKKNSYLNFMVANAKSLWSKGTNKDLVLFGSAWDKKPGNSVDFTIQLSGIMLFEAMAELKKLSLVD